MAKNVEASSGPKFDWTVFRMTPRFQNGLLIVGTVNILTGDVSVSSDRINAILGHVENFDAPREVCLFKREHARSARSRVFASLLRALSVARSSSREKAAARVAHF